MSTRHIAAESARLHDLTPEGSSGRASKRFRQKLAADGFTVDEGFRLKPGYLYTVVRAISARVNQNWDGWPSDELKKSYKTFIGKPVFVNHENHDPTKARGVVVAARYVENGMDKYIEVVQEIDAGRFPKLAHEIKTGGLDSVSMGAEAGFTICSYCHNKATDMEDMCDHVLNHKGKTLTRFDRRTGNKEDVLVFESCHKISFFELSYVFEPADETAVASKVVVAAKEVRVDDHGDDEYDPTKDPNSFEYQDPDMPLGYCEDCDGELGDRGVSAPQWDEHRGGWLCQDCLDGRRKENADLEMSMYHGWDPDDNPDADDPRIKGASKQHGGLRVAASPGHELHVFPPHEAPPVIHRSGETLIPGGGTDQHEWVHTLWGEPVNQGFARSHEEALAAAEASHRELADGFDPDKRSDPFDPRLIGASRKQAGGYSHDDDETSTPGPGKWRFYNNSTGETFHLHGPSQDEAWKKYVDQVGIPEDHDFGEDEENPYENTYVEPWDDPKSQYTHLEQLTDPQLSRDLLHGYDPDTDPFDPREFGASRTAGKYTKEDFAAAGSRKPWEKDVDSDADDAAAIEIEAMLSHDASATEDYEKWKAEFGQAADDEGTHGFNEHFPSWEQKRWLEQFERTQRRMAFHKHSGECIPGVNCRGTGMPQGEQIFKDSPNNPVNQPLAQGGAPGGGGLSGGGGSSSGYQGNGRSGRDGLNPAAQAFYDMISGEHPDLSLGGYNPTVDQSWDEHQTGDALDVMISDLERGNTIKDRALEQGAKHVIWQQNLYRPDGSFYKMPDRGSPTENHFDHVHINLPTPAGWKPTSVTSSGASSASSSSSSSGGMMQATPTGLQPAQRAARLVTAADLDSALYRLAGGFDPGWTPNDPDSLDVEDPDSAEEEIPDEPGGFADGWEPYKGRELDPSQEVYSHLNLHAVRQGLPGIWSFSQKVKVPHEETGKMVTKRLVVGYAPDAHLRDARMHVDRAAASKYHLAMQQHLADPDNVPAPKRTVHAGVIGHLSAPPAEPLPYSGIEYHPGDVYGDFVHRDDKEPVHTADVVHLAPDKRIYGAQADNWGRDHEPQLVVDPHPRVRASNKDTVWPPLDRQATIREAAINELYLGGVEPPRRAVTAALRKTARRRALKLAWGETEAPMSVDTLREEGSAPEDDNDDFERYVDPPKELQTPDLSEAGRVDRQQEVEAQGGDTGVPGQADPAGAPQQPAPGFITLQVPMPAEAPQVPQAAVPPQAPMPPEQGVPITASMLDWFDRYYGRRVANWMDAIEAGRGMTPEEAADYRRQAATLSTLENGRELSTTNRNSTKGTSQMARSSNASRSKVARGRRQHLAEGPLVDGGDRSRNDQGEQEEAFISQTPPEGTVDYPEASDGDISNTEHNLVAKVQRGREQLLRDAKALAAVQQRRAFDEAGGPVAEVVDPRVRDSASEELTGDDFVSANPNDGVVPTNPKDASLRAFAAFDSWLAQKTGKSSRRHTEANIKKAAAAFSREAGISPQALFPALGIVLREARKNGKQANTRGAKMRKRSNESLDVAAPGARIDVETPVKNTDAEAQASQFDVHDFGDNAGDNVANPDLSTDQNWAPGEASKTGARVKTAGGLLAMRCAEGMIAAGLEPDSRERKYQLAAEFENMNRGLIQDRVALLERFAAVRQAERRKVASGSSRGAARSPIPAGLGGGSRTASAGMRTAAHDPSNDSSLFI